MEVFVRQDSPADDIFVRLLRFDLSFSEAPPIEISLPVTNEPFDVRFWQTSFVDCFNCYAPDDDLAGVPSQTLAIEWQFAAPSPTAMARIPGDGSAVLVGLLDVTLPEIPDRYRLDLLSVGLEDPERGAELRFGFEPEIVWRAEFGEITGGRFDFDVAVPEPSALLLLGVGIVLASVQRRHQHAVPQRPGAR